MLAQCVKQEQINVRDHRGKEQSGRNTQPIALKELCERKIATDKTKNEDQKHKRPDRSKSIL